MSNLIGFLTMTLDVRKISYLDNNLFTKFI